MELNFNSVETIPNLNASAAFQVDSGKVFKEDTDIVPVIVDDTQRKTTNSGLYSSKFSEYNLKITGNF